jgi:hypothetical protein
MKYRALLSATAIVASTLISTPALATVSGTIPDQVAGSDATSTRDGACALVVANLNANAATGVSYTVIANWTGQSSVYGDEVPGTRSETPGTRQIAPGALVVSFSNVDASGASHLSRNGNSPNIFATDAVAHTVTYDNSTYAFTATYNISTTFSYSCDVTKHVAGTPATSRLEDFEECVTRMAQDGVANGVQVPGIYCKDVNNRITINVPGTDPQTNPDAEDSTTGTAGPQAGTASGGDTELNGGQYTFQNQSLPVSAVVCISPGSKGGSWKAQNLYAGLGGTCSTATFMSLPPNTGIPSVSLPTS